MSFSISWVLPRLAVGSAPQTVSDAQRLKVLGVTDVLDLRLHPVDNGETVTGGEIYDGTGIRYHSTPMRDNGEQKSVAQYVDAVTFVRDALAQAGTKVFIHCAAGEYRSPSTVYAVLRAMGYDPTAAWSAITSVRHVYDQYKPGAEASVPSLPRVTLGNSTSAEWIGGALVLAAVTGLVVYAWTSGTIRSMRA